MLVSPCHGVPVRVVNSTLEWYACPKCQATCDPVWLPTPPAVMARKASQRKNQRLLMLATLAACMFALAFGWARAIDAALVRLLSHW